MPYQGQDDQDEDNLPSPQKDALDGGSTAATPSVASSAPWGKSLAGQQARAGANGQGSAASVPGQGPVGQPGIPTPPWARAPGANGPPAAGAPSSAISGGAPQGPPPWAQPGQQMTGPNWGALAQNLGGAPGGQPPPLAPMQQGPAMAPQRPMGPPMAPGNPGAINPLAQQAAQALAARQTGQPMQGGRPMPMGRPPWQGR